MTRWLQLDDKLINLDHVTMVGPWKTASGHVQGVSFEFDRDDLLYRTSSKSVEEVYRLIECAEGPEPPKARA